MYSGSRPMVRFSASAEIYRNIDGAPESNRERDEDGERGALPESPDPLTRTTVRYPFSEEIDASLLPRTFAFRWERRHDSAANPANPVEDGGRMSLYVIITRQVERLAHRLNISLRKKWPDVGFEAGQLAHCASLLCPRPVDSRKREPQSGDFHSMPYLAKIELIVPLAFNLSRDVLIFFKSSPSVLRTPSASGPVIKDR